MKKIIFALAALSISNIALSQSFSIPHDTVSATVTTSMNMYNNMTSLSASDIFVNWRVTNHNLPADWASSFAICDNYLCYYNINNSLIGGNTFTTDTISPNETANFYVLPDLTNATTSGTYFVEVQMKEGTTSILSWYIISKWATGVEAVAYHNRSLVAYPNPANDELNLLVDNSLNIERVLVANIEGRIVGDFTLTNTNLSIPLSGFTPGIYVVKALGRNGQIESTTKFTKM
jgi:hypothetical protein